MRAIRLIIVYLTGRDVRGPMSGVRDAQGQAVAECPLYRLTNRQFGPVDFWKCYLARLQLEVDVMDAEQFRRQHPQAGEIVLPAVLAELEGELELLLSADTIAEANNVMTLIGLLHDALRVHALREVV